MVSFAFIDRHFPPARRVPRHPPLQRPHHRHGRPVGRHPHGDPPRGVPGLPGGLLAAGGAGVPGADRQGQGRLREDRNQAGDGQGIVSLWLLEELILIPKFIDCYTFFAFSGDTFGLA